MASSGNRSVRPPTGRVTLSQVARRAGVSVSTASFVLNDAPLAEKLSTATRAKVRRAARSLGYRPNELARAMVKGQTRVVAFCVPYVGAEWIARSLDGFIQEAGKQNYFVKAVPMLKDNWKEDFDRILDAQPAAVVCHELFHKQESHICTLAKRHGIPAGCTGESLIRAWNFAVTPDTGQAARRVIEHLAALGHHRIVHLGGDPGLASASLREQSYRAEMKRCGLKPEVHWAHYRLEDADRITRRLVDGHRGPLAIYCANDPMALVVLRTLRSLGLQVPRDASVVGYSDLMAAHLSDPPLTTVNEKIGECAGELARLLFAHLQSERPLKSARPRQLVPSELVVRGSTGPA